MMDAYSVLITHLTQSDWNHSIPSLTGTYSKNNFETNLRNLSCIADFFSRQIFDEKSINLIRDRCTQFIDQLKTGKEILSAYRVSSCFYQFSEILFIFKDGEKKLPSYYKQILSKDSLFFKNHFLTNTNLIRLDNIELESFILFLKFIYETCFIDEPLWLNLNKFYEMSLYFEIDREIIDQPLFSTLNTLLEKDAYAFIYACKSLDEPYNKKALQRYFQKLFSFLIETEWGKTIPSPTKLKFKKLGRFKEHLEYFKQILILLDICENEIIKQKCLTFLKNLPLDRKLLIAYEACHDQFSLPELIIQLKEGIFYFPGIYKLSFDRYASLKEPFHLKDVSYSRFNSLIKTLYHDWKSQDLEKFPDHYLIAYKLQMPKALKRLDKLTYKMVLKILQKERDFEKAVKVYQSYLETKCTTAFTSLISAFNWILTDLCEADLDLLLDKLKNLSSIEFAITPNSLEQLVQILNSALALKHLDCSRIGKLSGNELKQFKNFPELTSLNLTYCLWLRDEDLVHLYSLKLTRLILGSLFQLSNEAISNLAKHMPYLKELNIDGCLEIKQLHFLKYLPRLEHFSLQSLLLNSYHPLSQCLKLKTLNLLDCTHVNDQELAVLPNLRHLESLQLSAHLLTDIGLNRIVECKTLRRLKLWSCKLFTDQSLLDLVEALPALSEFTCDHPFKDHTISLKISEKLKIARGH